MLRYELVIITIIVSHYTPSLIRGCHGIKILSEKNNIRNENSNESSLRINTEIKFNHYEGGT